MKNGRMCWLLAALCTSTLWATSSASATVFLPNGVSDKVYINGGLPSNGTAFEGQENGTFPTGLFASNDHQANQAVILTEQDGTTPSDVAWLDSSLQIIIASDMENGTFPVGVPSLSTLKVLQSLVETGNLQDIGTYFGLNAGVLQVASDVSEAPLPAALPLFASGLGFIGFLARRKKQRAVVG